MSNVAAMKSSNHFRGGAPQLQGWQVQTEVTGSPSMWADKSFSRPGIFSSALYVTLVYSGSLSSMLKFSHVKSQVHNLSEGALLHAGSYVRTPGGRCRSKVVLVLNYKRMPSFFILIQMILSTVARTSPVLTCWTEVRDTLSLFSTTSALAVSSLTPM